MKGEYLALLQRAQDRIVAIELTSGQQLFAEIIFLFADGDTPDVFIWPAAQKKNGTFVVLKTHGESILLADIARVALIPGVEYLPLIA